MASPLHSKQVVADGIHTSISYEYANAAARTGATGFVAADVGKFARQTDNQSLWMLLDTVPTWKSFLSGFNYLVKNVAGAVDVTLTTADIGNDAIELTGAITANINVIVPTVLGQWTFDNKTTGAFTVTVKTAAGTGVVVNQDASYILYCDGVNIDPSVTIGVGAQPLLNNSAGLAAALSDETGSGLAVFNNSPTLITPNIGSATGSISGNAGSANALKSATTTIDVSAATAPASGQVLTATSGTTATWQTTNVAGAGNAYGWFIGG